MVLIRSWVESANSPTTEFPLNNLPCGVFSTEETEPRPGVAIGDRIVDIARLEEEGIIVPEGGPVFDVPFWNDFMELGGDAWAAFRAQLTALLAEGSSDRERIEPMLVPMANARLHMPFAVSEYTDFYAGYHHATNVGMMFRGAENALPPNWLHMPIGYNGRASSVVVSGTDIHRPMGQLKGVDDDPPYFAASQKFDIELEMGAVLGGASDGPVSVAEADQMIFGYVLLNDWSARDIQAWEYQPLGPFQSKATATSISPWIVTRAALEPFRTDTPPRIHPLLDYIRDDGPMLYDIDLTVAIQPEGAGQETVLARTNHRELYYSSAQQIAHHASSGCPMNCGDLIGSGTISGPLRENRGSLLELSWGGKEPVEIGNGMSRSFIEDGDRLTLRGGASGDGYRIGFGECTGKVLPAR